MQDVARAQAEALQSQLTVEERECCTRDARIRKLRTNLGSVRLELERREKDVLVPALSAQPASTVSSLAAPALLPYGLAAVSLAPSATATALEESLQILNLSEEERLT